MGVETQRARKRRRLVPGRVPDPLRAHGAWVYLAVSELAGMLVAPPGGWAPALAAGGGFVGVFVLAGALAVAGRGAVVTRGLLGLSLAAGLPLLALALGADRSFLAVGLAAVPPALVAAYCAWRDGFLSPGALAFAVTGLVVAAPVAATAGGAGPGRALWLLAALAPVFFWRTWRLARDFGSGWTRRRFQRQGLVESGIAVAWAAAVVAAVRLLG